MQDTCPTILFDDLFIPNVFQFSKYYRTELKERQKTAHRELMQRKRTEEKTQNELKEIAKLTQTNDEFISSLLNQLFLNIPKKSEQLKQRKERLLEREEKLRGK